MSTLTLDKLHPQGLDGPMNGYLLELERLLRQSSENGGTNADLSLKQQVMSIVENMNKVPDSVCFITDDSDFPTPVGGEHLLEAKMYIIVGQVDYTNTLVPPTNESCQIIGFNGQLNYLGTGTAIQNTAYQNGQLLIRSMFQMSAPNGQLLDVTGTEFGFVLFDTVAIVGVDNIGH